MGSNVVTLHTFYSQFLDCKMKNRLREPRLIADIGGTHGRFCLENAPGQFSKLRVLKTNNFPSLSAAIKAYLTEIDAKDIRFAAVALAGVVDRDKARMTNAPYWSFSIEDERRRSALDCLLVENDFKALARSLPFLSAAQKAKIGKGTCQAQYPICVIGPGTGLGTAALAPSGNGWVVIESEGGHTTLSLDTTNEDERVVGDFLWNKLQAHVSAERVLSGPGLSNIYEAFSGNKWAPEQIIEAAKSNTAHLPLRSIELFSKLLGRYCGNVALTFGARGGIYLAGGLVSYTGSTFRQDIFHAEFIRKGRLSEYLTSIGTYIVTHPNPAFLGAAAGLAEELQSRQNNTDDKVKPQSLLPVIEQRLPTFSPAHKRVAEYILSHSISAAQDPISVVAKRAGVSEPTVLRFCRHLGCGGFPELKSRL